VDGQRPREEQIVTFPGGWELVLILLVVLVLFGAKRLPDSARALGRSMRILKAETKGLREDTDDAESHRDARHDTTVTAEPLPPGQPPAAGYGQQQPYAAPPPQQQPYAAPQPAQQPPYAQPDPGQSPPPQTPGSAQPGGSVPYGDQAQQPRP
jgi:sec-independent protein translocase protein TatA